MIGNSIQREISAYTAFKSVSFLQIIETCPWQIPVVRKQIKYNSVRQGAYRNLYSSSDFYHLVDTKPIAIFGLQKL